MADKITDSKILGIGFEWFNIEDGKQKISYMKIPNPRDNLTEAQIKTAANAFLTGTNPILQDTYAHSPQENPLTCKTAYVETTRTTDYDLGFSDNF